jgi:hypothetical protein
MHFKALLARPAADIRDRREGVARAHSVSLPVRQALDGHNPPVAVSN